MFTERLKLEIGVISIVHIISIILAIVFFMVFYMKANKDYALKAFLVTQVSMIMWMVFKIFKTVSPTVVSRWWFIVGYYLCACVLEIAFLEFGYAYYKGKPITKRIRYALYVLPALQFIMVLTNPYHHLFYASYHFFGDSFGIGFYIHTAIEYVYIAVGFVYCYKMFRVRFSDKPYWYKYAISSAIVVPLILNLLFITKVIHRFVFAIGIPVVFDITPIVFTWSVMVFAYATFNSDFLNLSPMLRHEIVHRLDTPICLLDSAHSVIYVNQRLDHLFKGDGRKYMERFMDSFGLGGMDGSEICYEGYYITVQSTMIRTFTETQHILVVKDITDYKNIEEEINSSQREISASNIALEETINHLKETSKVGARSYVARELHDVIGHSLVVAIKLIEVARLYLDKDRTQSKSALKDASSALESGIETMQNITSRGNVESHYDGELLKKDLTNMLKLISNTEVKANLSIKGLNQSVDEVVFDMVKKICTELVTNTLKHSNAKEIFISINIKEDLLTMMVIDNGRGVEVLTKGNGLKGIEERLKLVDGHVDFITSLDEGFMSKITLQMA